MKYKVTKVFNFSYGHRLSDYDGKCKNLHGHNGVCEVTVEAEVLDKTGMVIDFGILKTIFEKEIDSYFDHHTLLYTHDELNQKLFNVLGPTRDDFRIVNYNPTAENIAKDIYERLQSSLLRGGNGQSLELGMRLTKVVLWETPTSFAVYEA